MKKKFLMISAIISLLLVSFPFTLCAEDAPASDPGSPPGSLTPGLDSYFWENYDLLPYIESDGHQIINTNVSASNNLVINMTFGGLQSRDNWQPLIFDNGDGTSGRYGLQVYRNNEYMYFYSDRHQFEVNLNDQYYIYSFKSDGNVFTLNDFEYSFTDRSFTGSNIYLFGFNNQYSAYKLYNLTIYDKSYNSGEGQYLKYYYPAKAKSGGTIGLYDAVSKTFVTTSGSVPFENPSGSDVVLSFSAFINTFIFNGLSWIGDIFEFVVEEPLLLAFMAIGLCGVAFRWARRLVHF